MTTMASYQFHHHRSPFKSPSKSKRPTLPELKAARDDYRLELESRITTLTKNHKQHLESLRRVADSECALLQDAVATLSVADFFDLYKGDPAAANEAIINNTLREGAEKRVNETASVLASTRKPKRQAKDLSPSPTKKKSRPSPRHPSDPDGWHLVSPQPPLPTPSTSRTRVPASSHRSVPPSASSSKKTSTSTATSGLKKGSTLPPPPSSTSKKPTASDLRRSSRSRSNSAAPAPLVSSTSSLSLSEFTYSPPSNAPSYLVALLRDQREMEERQRALKREMEEEQAKMQARLRACLEETEMPEGERERLKIKLGVVAEGF